MSLCVVVSWNNLLYRFKSATYFYYTYINICVHIYFFNSKDIERQSIKMKLGLFFEEVYKVFETNLLRGFTQYNNS